MSSRLANEDRFSPLTRGYLSHCSTTEIRRLNNDLSIAAADLRDGDVLMIFMESDQGVDVAKEPQMERLSPPSVKVFIRYAREDSETAIRLCRDLRTNGISTWFDRDDLRPGQRWRSVITQCIRDCTHFLALISKNSINKDGYVQKELREALAVLEQKPPDQTLIIPVRLDDSVPRHEILTEITWVDLFPEYENAVRAIVQAVTGEASVRNASDEANALQVPVGLGLDIRTTTLDSAWLGGTCGWCQNRIRRGDGVEAG